MPTMTCPLCRGTGTVYRNHLPRTCHRCGGSGSVWVPGR